MARFCRVGIKSPVILTYWYNMLKNVELVWIFFFFPFSFFRSLFEVEHVEIFTRLALKVSVSKRQYINYTIKLLFGSSLLAFEKKNNSPRAPFSIVRFYYLSFFPYKFFFLNPG